MLTSLTTGLTALYRQLYPPCCLLCDGPGTATLDLCADCRKTLPLNHHACQYCGRTASTMQAEPCPACPLTPLDQNGTYTAFVYQEPVRYLIRAFKFHGNHTAGRLLGNLMAERFSLLEPRPQALIPVPLHRTRYQERGYNQAIELARPIAHRLGIPLALDACYRTRHTQAQSELSAEQRTVNIRGSFQATKQLQAKHIAIVDDVVTTGSTVSELSKCLREQGVQRIDVWGCARAEGPEPASKSFTKPLITQ